MVEVLGLQNVLYISSNPEEATLTGGKIHMIEAYPA